MFFIKRIAAGLCLVSLFSFPSCAAFGKVSISVNDVDYVGFTEYYLNTVEFYQVYADSQDNFLKDIKKMKIYKRNFECRCAEPMFITIYYLDGSHISFGPFRYRKYDENGEIIQQFQIYNTNTRITAGALYAKYITNK